MHSSLYLNMADTKDQHLFSANQFLKDFPVSLFGQQRCTAKNQWVCLMRSLPRLRDSHLKPAKLSSLFLNVSVRCIADLTITTYNNQCYVWQSVSVWQSVTTFSVGIKGDVSKFNGSCKSPYQEHSCWEMCIYSTFVCIQSLYSKAK